MQFDDIFYHNFQTIPLIAHISSKIGESYQQSIDKPQNIIKNKTFIVKIALFLLHEHHQDKERQRKHIAHYLLGYHHRTCEVEQEEDWVDSFSVIPMVHLHNQVEVHTEEDIAGLVNFIEILHLLRSGAHYYKIEFLLLFMLLQKIYMDIAFHSEVNTRNRRAANVERYDDRMFLLLFGWLNHEVQIHVF